MISPSGYLCNRIAHIFSEDSQYSAEDSLETEYIVFFKHISDLGWAGLQALDRGLKTPINPWGYPQDRNRSESKQVDKCRL